MHWAAGGHLSSCSSCYLRFAMLLLQK